MAEEKGGVQAVTRYDTADRQVEVRVKLDRPTRVKVMEEHLTHALAIADELAKDAMNADQVQQMHTGMDRAEQAIRDALAALDKDYNPLKARGILAAYLDA